MSIQNYLNKIKDAVFGKDIREAIYASIKQCYDDAAVNHDNANMEVKFARGSHPTLNDRLTEHEKNQKEINEQLDNIANKGTTVEVLERVTKEEIDRQIKDGTIANLTMETNSLSIDKANDYFNNALLTERLQSTWEIGSLSSTTGGLLYNNKNRIRTVDFISNVDYIVFKGDEQYQYLVLKYNKDGEFISSTGWLKKDKALVYVEKNAKIKILIAYSDNRAITNDEIIELTKFIMINKIIDKKEIVYKKDLKSIVNKEENINNLITKVSIPYGGAYMSSNCIIDNELWVFHTGKDDFSNSVKVQRFTIDLNNNNIVQKDDFYHQWGHLNSCSYNKYKDALIFGNGSSDSSLPNKFYIYPNPKGIIGGQYKDLSSAIEYDLSSLNWGIKCNVCWGEDNAGVGNIAYVITNNNKNIRKILLGLGENNLELGSFINGKNDNEFNGTFKVLNEWSQEDGDEVNQGTCYFNGHLYIGLGHSTLWYSKNKLLNNNVIEKTIVKDYFYDNLGNILDRTMQGITVTADFIAIGLQNGGENEVYIYAK